MIVALSMLLALVTPPVLLTADRADSLTAEQLDDLLLEGIQHRKIVAKDIRRDPYGNLDSVLLVEAGRQSGPALCARTVHRIKFDKGNVFNRSLDHYQALGSDCESPPRWTRLQLGASPEVGAKLVGELTAAQARVRQGEPSGLEIACVDNTGRGLCAPDLEWQLGTMDMAMLGAIEGRSQHEGYRFRAWFPQDKATGVAWESHYQPIRESKDRLLMRARIPIPGAPPPPPPPPPSS